MTDVFIKIVNMSISASYIVLAVLLIRKVLSKAPKWINTLLWGIVAIKLVFPLSIRSPFSLIPSAETVDPNIITDITPSINTGFAVINEAINPIIFESLSPVHYESATPLQIVLPVLSVLWLVGTVGIITYGIFSSFKLKKTLNSAVKIEDNIYKSSCVSSPIVLGIKDPKIYLPINLNENDLSSVIAHEKAHIKRKDHILKPIGFLLLALH